MAYEQERQRREVYVVRCEECVCVRPAPSRGEGVARTCSLLLASRRITRSGAQATARRASERVFVPARADLCTRAASVATTSSSVSIDRTIDPSRHRRPQPHARVHTHARAIDARSSTTYCHTHSGRCTRTKAARHHGHSYVVHSRRDGRSCSARAHRRGGPWTLHHDRVPRERRD